MTQQQSTPATTLSHLRVLISGASIAGPAAALQLARYGAQVTVVEKAPALRRGGFAVDFRGSVHRRVLKDMGIWDEVHRRQTHMGKQTVVNADGSPRVDLPAAFMSGDVEIFRGELSALMYERTRDLPNVTYRFGDSIETLTESAAHVDVTFEQAPPARFDLVVGADGLHSHTRRLVFGDESRFLHHLGFYVAGFDAPNHLKLDRTAHLYCEPNRMAGLSNYDGDLDRAGAFLVFASEEELEYDRRDPERKEQKAILRERYAGLGWHTPALLAALEDADDLYFDSVAQIRIDRLSKGRVVLLGDAGYGATMGGMGTGAAIVAAYVLAGELAAARGDHRTAFAAYESEVGDFVKGCQQAAGNAGPFFAPASVRKIRQRDRMYRMLGSRLLGGLFKRLTEKAATGITLKSYPR